MKVLIIGSGGREHALAWQCAQFDEVVQVFVAPGNAGSALENKISNIQIDSEDIPGLIEFAQSESDRYYDCWARGSSRNWDC